MTEAEEIAERIAQYYDLGKIKSEATLSHIVSHECYAPDIVGYQVFDNILTALRQLWLRAGGSNG